MLYCDLDDVLVDWQTNILSEIPDFWLLKIEERFKILIEKGEKFWSDLPWTKDGEELWENIKIYKPIILSAGAIGKYQVHDFVRKGKIEWVKKNLSTDTEIIVCHRREKKNYSKIGNILIDDNEKNINEWKDYGGIGILHTNSKKTIGDLNEIKKILE
jgi:hypothetical protein